MSMYPHSYHLIRIEPPPYEVEVASDQIETVDIEGGTATSTAPHTQQAPSTFQILNVGVFGLGWRAAAPAQPAAAPSNNNTEDSIPETCV